MDQQEKVKRKPLEGKNSGRGTRDGQWYARERPGKLELSPTVSSPKATEDPTNSDLQQTVAAGRRLV